MRAILNVFDGPAKGQYVIHDSGKLTVGRTTGFVVNADPFLSRAHFEIELVDNRCLVRDLKSGNGTQLNGTPIDEAEAHDGDEINAGHSAFQVMLELSDDISSGDATQAQETELAKFTKAQAGLWRILQVTQPLFATVDCALGEPARDFVALATTPTKNLFEGEKGEELARFAPYLVGLPDRSEALRRYIQRGWGTHWGILFSCPLPFLEVRRHLRRFLLVKMPDGKTNYFRYYDPRVLRSFLPKLSPQEVARFFGPITQFLIPAEDSEILVRFTHVNGVLKRMEIPLAAQAKPEEAHV